MLKTIRENLYFIKVWYGDIFKYPKDKLSVDESLDYDKYWDVKRASHVARLSDWQKNRADIILKFMRLNNVGKPVSIADIACGEGTILKYINEHFKVSEFTGYDSSDRILAMAKEIGINGIKMDLNREEDMALIKTADYFLMLEILEHIPGSEKLLRAAYQRANLGVFFSVPNTGYFIYRLRMLFGRFPKQWYNMPNEHLRYWTYKDMKWWLKAQGYSNYVVACYKGIPVLNKIMPGLFGAAFVVFINKN